MLCYRASIVGKVTQASMRKLSTLITVLIYLIFALTLPLLHGLQFVRLTTDSNNNDDNSQHNVYKSAHDIVSGDSEDSPFFTYHHGLRMSPITTTPPQNSPPPHHLRDFTDPKSVTPKIHPTMCDGYDGILKINNGDHGAATGTAFFTYVVNQIIYAEEHNLLPWVHFTPQSRSQIYDPEVHDVPPKKHPSGDEREAISIPLLAGTAVVERFETSDDSRKCLDGDVPYPGPPDYDNSVLRYEIATLDTTGVWDCYFEPVSKFVPSEMTPEDRLSCKEIPYVDLSPYLYPGIHLCAPWSLRNWVYNDMPEAYKPEKDPIATNKWIDQMRIRGHDIVSRYIHPQKWLLDLVDIVNPIAIPADSSSSSSSSSSPPCLAMHIRHTDKKDGRHHVPLDDFLPYASTFLHLGGRTIYLATDQLQNVHHVEKHWPTHVVDAIRRQTNAFLSGTQKAVFRQISHDRSNREALVDIYAMSRCGVIVHGYSAMSEAAIYVNGSLRNKSVNLESGWKMTEGEFEEMVRGVLSVVG